MRAVWQRGVFRLAGCFTASAPLLLAGVLPLQPDLSHSWAWSGGWIYPAGNPYSLTAPAVDGAACYHVTRGVNDRDHGSARHEGVDLTCGCGGGEVRAAGTGLVVAADGTGWNRGFGGHVVIAHRLPGDGLVYSVYAHLASGSATVKPGCLVGAGEIIGRVGKTGRATSAHLHFEIRRPNDPDERWENAKAIDPLAFVAARLPAARDDSTWARPYLEWAECACVFRPGAQGDSLPSRAEWWRALAAATRLPFSAFPANDDTLRQALVLAGILPDSPKAALSSPLGWSEVVRDLDAARGFGLRLPPSPVAEVSRRSSCARELGTESPAGQPGELPRTARERPTRARLSLLLADLAGDPPAKPAAASRSPHGS